MKAIRVIQSIWAATLVAILATVSLSALLNAQGARGLPSLALGVGYLYACIRAWRSSRAAWVIALAVPVVTCALWLPMVILNLVAFIRHDSLYLDSPSTIFIVASYALVLVLPSVVLIALFWRHRAALQALISAPRTGAA
jgi:hypothetical protein